MVTDPTPQAPHEAALITADDPRDRHAGTRIFRLFALFVAVGYLAYGLAAVPVIADSVPVMATWWTVLSLTVIFLPGLLPLGIAWRATICQLRIVAALAVGGYMLAMVTWWFGWDGSDVNTTTGIWFSMFFGLAALASAIAFPARYAFAILAAVATGSTVINHQIRPPALNAALVPDIAWAVGFSLVFVAAGTMAARTAGFLDSSRAQALAASADAAASQASNRERARFDALTHDSVMATLLLAARQGATPEIAQQARTAIAALDRSSIGDEIAIAVGDADAQIRAAICLITSQVTITSTAAGDPTATVPGSAVTAIASAAAEAVRNSLRHAGPDATTVVDIDIAATHLTVGVADDGMGFDPDTVPASRFGIAVSIADRMSRLPGGRADVDSAPGQGTRIRLDWRR